MSHARVKVTLLLPAFATGPGVVDLRVSEGRANEPWQSQLTALLGQSVWTAQHLPDAALQLIEDGARPVSTAVACADPVHLRADRDTATLMPPATLRLDEEEADALLKTINGFLAEDGLHVSRNGVDRWIVHGRDASRLASYPPTFLAQRNASAFLPEGEGSGDWRRLMTELQMLLHDHPVNVDRERRGRLPVNSLWFWGGAGLDSVEAKPDTLIQSTVLYADDPFATALARYLGVHCQSLAAFDPAANHAQTLLVDTALADALFSTDHCAHLQAEQRIDSMILRPLTERITGGDSVSVEILNEDGWQGELDADIVREQQLEARASQLSQTASARLSHQLVVKAKRAWQRLAGNS